MKFSVAMCTYNGARFLGQQLASIGGQTRTPDELVVCDDGSVDQTVSIIESFTESVTFPVRLRVNECRLGSTKNFEQAIRLCTGDFIALADQDDVWIPSKLAMLETEFAADSGVGLVFSDGEIINDDGIALGVSLWETIGVTRRETNRLRAGQGFEALLHGSTITGATMAFASKFKDLVIPFPANISFIHDAWIVILIAAVAGVRPVEAQLIKYRQHGCQQVGPLPRQSEIGGVRAVLRGTVHESLARENKYAATLAIAETVRERLAKKAEFGGEKARAALEDRITHFRARNSLPKSKFKRLPSITKELLSGRYDRYSNSFLSAFKDLIAG